MKNRRNYYRILHVQPDAPVEVIRSSYRTIMQKLRAHPDLGGDEWNASLINEAYAVVTDVEKRAAYDATLRHSTCQRTVNSNAPTGDPVTPSSVSPGHVRCSFCDALQRRTGVYRADDRCVRCNSPLAPLVPMVLEHSCKRAIARMATCSNVEIFSRWPQVHAQRGTIIDLSPNGLGLRLPVALSAGTVIKLDSRLLSATARIVNCLSQVGRGERFYQIGAVFLTLEFTELSGTFVSGHA